MRSLKCKHHSCLWSLLSTQNNFLTPAFPHITSRAVLVKATTACFSTHHITCNACEGYYTPTACRWVYDDRSIVCVLTACFCSVLYIFGEGESACLHVHCKHHPKLQRETCQHDAIVSPLWPSSLDSASGKQKGPEHLLFARP